MFITLSDRTDTRRPLFNIEGAISISTENDILSIVTNEYTAIIGGDSALTNTSDQTFERARGFTQHARETGSLHFSLSDWRIVEASDSRS